MAHSALLIADYILANRRQSYTPIHVIKLAYICHGWTLALLDRPLVAERVEAWKYGPVIPVVYYAFRRYGSGMIDRLYYGNTPLEPEANLDAWRDFVSAELPKDSEEADVMEQVLDVYGLLSPLDFFHLTHRKNSPWMRHYVEGNMHNEIPDDTTREYYRSVASNAS